MNKIPEEFFWGESWRGGKTEIGERRPQQRNPPKNTKCFKCKFGYEKLDSGFARSDGIDILLYTPTFLFSFDSKKQRI